MRAVVTRTVGLIGFYISKYIFSRLRGENKDG